MIDGIGAYTQNTQDANNYAANLTTEVKNKIADKTSAGEQAKDLSSIAQCETCQNRTYQDGSDDPGVSFKSPTKLSRGEAAKQVVAHEREHYSRENAKAEMENKDVVSNNIQIYTNVCPECGSSYVSGGTTTTITREKAENAEMSKKFFDQNVGQYMPKFVDEKI